MRLLYIVVLASRNDCDSTRSDSDVSRSDILCFNSDEHDVRYSSPVLRVHRSHQSHPSGPGSSNLQKNHRLASSTKDSVVHIPSNRLEVTVHRAYEEHPMNQMNQMNQTVSYISSDAQLSDKPPHELAFEDNDNVENRDEKV